MDPPPIAVRVLSLRRPEEKENDQEDGGSCGGGGGGGGGRVVGCHENLVAI